MMLHTKYQGARPPGFRPEDFFRFSLFCYFTSQVNSCGHGHVTPRGSPFLAPGAYLNNFGIGPLGDAKYQISRL